MKIFSYEQDLYRKKKKKKERRKEFILRRKNDDVRNTVSMTENSYFNVKITLRESQGSPHMSDGQLINFTQKSIAPYEIVLAASFVTRYILYYYV